ncbi:MAG TPA: DUF6542 domain-containing protein [Jatrophihabitans sp.]|nr:DUF6542 domain-containing protein [Jatrophihabitans sp.]
MTYPSAPNGRGQSSPGDGSGRPASRKLEDDGWGPSTAVHSGSARRVGRAFDYPVVPGADQPRTPESRPAEPPWSAAGPLGRGQQRATRAAEGRNAAVMPPVRAPERGVPWWAALIILAAIAALGGVIDTVGSIQVQGGFNIGVIVASIVAILVVKRSHMFPIVISPPIVYSLAAVFQLYIRSRGLTDKGTVLDGAANYLVYGFPAIAAATAAVLIIAGIRLIVRK